MNSEASAPDQREPEREEVVGRLSALDRALSLVRYVLRTSPLVVALVVLAAMGYVLFTALRTRPDFDHLVVSDSYAELKAEDLSWSITFEQVNDSQFAGVVRYISRWHDRTMRIVTHDLLVAAGDYTDPKKVSTAVFDHHLWFRHTSGQALRGTINLLHIVPANEKVYRRLLWIRLGDKVAITGREIATISAYDKGGTLRGVTQDEGCNSILVRSVAIGSKATR